MQINTEEGKQTIDWWLRKSSRDKVLVIMAIILTISVYLNVGFIKGERVSYNNSRFYRDSIADVYEKILEARVADYRVQAENILKRSEKQAEDCEKSKKETERLNIEYQKLLMEYVNLKNKKN